MGFLNAVLGRIRGTGNVAGDSSPSNSPAAARDRPSRAEDCIGRGLGRHEAGDLQAAESDYREALRIAPDHADAHYLLGSLLGASGRLDEALEHLLEAARLDPSAAAAHADTGNVYRMQGRLAEAEAAYRHAIAIDADLAGAHRNLGDLLNAAGRVDEAIDCLARAAALAADEAEPQFMLADLLAGRGRYEEACRSYRAGLGIVPDAAAAHNNLGATLRHLSRTEEARQCFETALRLDSALGDAHANLAELLYGAGSIERAIEHYRAAAGLQSDAVHCRRSLGALLLEAGRAEEAVASYREVLILDPQAARSHYELGNALAVAGRLDEAVERLSQAVRLDPEDANAQVNLGFALNSSKRFEDARQCFLRALALDTDLVEAHNNLGGVLQMQGELRPAMQAYQRALSLAPDQLYVRSNYLTCLNYHDEAVPEDVFAQHRQWSASFANEPAAVTPAPLREPEAERRLRIGYVSADFRFHSVAFFIAPILEHHDRARFEVTCYANVAKPDANTERLRALSDHWRDIAGLSDAEVAAWIRRDAIDVLVDLSGHTVGNRLAVFAARPAPVQVTYLGYPNTTGLAAMDYRITDALADPPGRSDRLHSEELIRLDQSFLCYRPLQSCPEVRERGPFAEGAGITFASFNELLKLTPPTVRAWCEILERTPGSKLLIKGTTLEDDGTRQIVANRFAEHGLDSARLELVGRTPTLEAHLELYNKVDIGLDTFPYNGTTTTCEALWMGVPVVSQVGEVHASRVGLSLLSNVGLEDLVADDVAQYVAKAVALAHDHERRRQLRLSLRERMRSCALMDGQAATRRIEAAYRDMWRRACRAAAPSAGSQAGRAMAVAIRDGLRVHVPARISELTPYVLLEQEDWFEDEIHFVRRALEPGMRCLDIGANYGVFTLTCARRVGPGGRIWSFEPTPATASFLSTSIRENAIENINLMGCALSRASGQAKLVTHADSEHNYLSDRVADDASFEIVDVRTLDEVAEEQNLTGIDFVKVDAEGAEIDILEGGGRFFERESPVVMFEYKYREGANLPLVEAVQARGYEIYRLIPGLQILAAFDRDDVDAFQLNLFAIKPERVQALEASGLVVARESPAASAGHVHPGDFLGDLGRRPYARELLQGWRQRVAGGLPAQLHSGLACYCRARDESLPAHARLEALRAAHTHLSEPQGPGSETARLYSLARVAAELGRRQEAVEILNTICSKVDSQSHTPGEVPFLPVGARFDDIEPGDAFAQWCLVSVLEQRERLAAYSSYFQNERALAVLEMLEQLPFRCAEMERRRQLMCIRLGRQTAPQPRELLARAADDNLNPDFWMSAGAAEPKT